PQRLVTRPAQAGTARSTCREPLSPATTPAVPIRVAGGLRSFAFPWLSVLRLVGTPPKTTPAFFSSWGLLVGGAPRCERPRRPALEASLFVATSLLLATSNRSTWKIPSLSWIRGVGRARVTDIHVLAARKVVYEQDRTSRRRGLIRGVSSWRRAKPVG